MKTIKIQVWRGMVSEVTGLPKGYNYEVEDLDVQENGG